MWRLALVLLGGCDYLLHLDHLPPADADHPIDQGTTSDAFDSVRIEAENAAVQLASTDGIHSWQSFTDALASNGQYMQVVPTNVGSCTNTTMLRTCAAELDYQLPIDTTAMYYVQIRMQGASNTGNSIWYAVDQAMPTEMQVVGDSTWHWVVGTGTVLSMVSAHTFTIWSREWGESVDVIALTRSSTPLM